MFDKEIIQQFQTKILERYAVHRRDLPWRDCENPYWIFLSEIMLQQTQVDRVIPKFLQFVEKVPNRESLSILSKQDLLTLRLGLGFNSRALRLQEAGRIILDQYHGKIPANRETLLRLPGIGTYTSASLLAFVYNMAVPVIDTNIRRVLIWELGLKENISRQKLEEIALDCIPEGKSRDWHHALMDYGALVCTVKTTGIQSQSKQSKFKGSDREVRGWIIKELVAHRFVDLNRIKKNFPGKDGEKIVLGLVKEGVVEMREEGLRIKA